MMKKKKYIFDRIIKFQIMVFLCMAFFLSWMSICTVREPEWINTAVLIFLWCCFIAGTVIFTGRIYLPYKRLEKPYRQFSEGLIYEELFDEEIAVSRETDMVLEKLRRMLENMDILNASKQQAQYLALQNQINPHFLYNTLESIRSDALYNDMTDIARITGALSLFFRYTISNMDKISSLSDELENVENYFIIQKYRFGERIDLRILLPDTEDCLNMAVPKLTLQPIVENAIIHGIECLGTKGIIHIRVEVGQAGYYINVEDNGKGIPLEELEKLNRKLNMPGVDSELAVSRKKGGIALRNVSQRIKLLYGDEYGLKVFSTLDMGTKVQIWLPVSYANEPK